ncbi:uncharacterized protein LOC124445646 [Xenia sp. Carnegie-2017]|uniref:uncharacterized protein LOC124445646 n=1 Tax=Xenia sp. Carnegie-2017 TaxID=2897299 RepID=UPI001F037209|nr:uncharacterized protein LOC124445646 [Xenia sp. Carnegie-2017]
MLSSDTNESYGSREMVHNGYSRSSTPDSSASSRLAAQLERSAYRRSRSKTRRKPSSKRGDADSGSISPRKTSRSRNLKQEKRSSWYNEDEIDTNIVYDLVNGGTTMPSVTRFESNFDKQITASSALGNSEKMDMQSNEDVFCENEEEMYVVNSYHINEEKYNSTLQPRLPLPSKEINSKSPERKNFTIMNSKASRNEKVDSRLYDKKNNSIRYNNISKVRFEESWSEASVRKCEYRVREASGISIPNRDESSRSEVQRTIVVNGEKNTLDSRKIKELNSDRVDKAEKSLQNKKTKVESTNSKNDIFDKSNSEYGQIVDSSKGFITNRNDANTNVNPGYRCMVDSNVEFSSNRNEANGKVNNGHMLMVDSNIGLNDNRIEANGKVNGGYRHMVDSNVGLNDNRIEANGKVNGGYRHMVDSNVGLNDNRIEANRKVNGGYRHMVDSNVGLNDNRIEANGKVNGGYRHMVDSNVGLNDNRIEANGKVNGGYRHMVEGNVGLNDNRIEANGRINNSEISESAPGQLKNNPLDDSKPLGLRQLIKIHEIQIAEVAKSAALLKKPEKAHEGRLVKVKIVPETKQSYVKHNNVAKVTFTGNIPSSQNTVRKMLRSEGAKDLLENNDGNEVLENVKAKGARRKRCTVEMRRKSPIQEDQRWKRHTAIGLVGFDYQEHEIQRVEWSPQCNHDARLFNDENDEKMDWERKLLSETGRQFVDEKRSKNEKNSQKTETVKNIKKNKSFEKDDNVKLIESSDSDVPPERPPLPKDFSNSDEKIVSRHPSLVNEVSLKNSSKLKTDCVPDVGYKSAVERRPSFENNRIIEVLPNMEYSPSFGKFKKPALIEQTHLVPLSSSLPAIHVSSTFEQIEENSALQNEAKEKDNILGKTRTTREMYEERLSRINLIPLDLTETQTANEDDSSHKCLELDVSSNVHSLDKDNYKCKLRTCMNQLETMTKQKEDLEKNFELERRNWIRKYEEQQKVANAYQKLEDRYRRQVQELQEALKSCKCQDARARKSLSHANFRKPKDSFTNQAQSILGETEEWLKAQSIRSDITCNLENMSNIKISNGTNLHLSRTDMDVEKTLCMDYKDYTFSSGIDQYNGTSV